MTHTDDPGIARPAYFEFDHLEPAAVSGRGSPTWCVRAQNLGLTLTRLRAGDVLDRRRQAHEYAILLPDDDDAVAVRWGAESVEVRGRAFVVVPRGDSAVTALVDATVVRLFDRRDTDVLAAARNADDYAGPHPRVAPLEPWPAPAEDRVRAYRLADVPVEEGRFGCIFRTSSFMINFLDDQHGPRDPDRLSPHHHDDFEQLSLAVRGTWTHHIRTPWSRRRSEWRDDEHRSVGSPSVAIIPPPTVHTSEARGTGVNRLIDIFSPPRADFSARPGWVVNADDYPAPAADG